MSDPTSAATPAESAKPAPAAPSADASAARAAAKPSAVGGLLKVVLPAMLAAGAAYGGTRVAGAHPPPAAAAAPAHEDKHAAMHPPGPTLLLEPFLVTVLDANKKSHPMKLSISVEFAHDTHEDLKQYTPRIRDAFLAHLRTLSHEQVTDPGQLERLRAELVERCKGIGAKGAERILVTDFVVQ